MTAGPQPQRFPKLASFKSADALAEHMRKLGAPLPLDDERIAGAQSPLAAPLRFRDGSAGELVAGNRFAILPMEGWDGSRDGAPTELVRRRWERFGAGGAKLVWGEATAVQRAGRANPNQLVIDQSTAPALASLRRALVDAHARQHDSTEDLLVGLQLTHSGRWSRPDGGAKPRIAYRHPWLDRRVGADDASLLSDADLDQLAADFVRAACLAEQAGFDFVDIKHCHGYLLHELIGARDRDGAYGGDWEGRTRLLHTVAAEIRERAPRLAIAVRLSVFDCAPHSPGPDGRGVCEAEGTYPHAFGGDGTGTGIDLDEPSRLLGDLEGLGVGLVCVTAGSPYYCPHIQRPAWYPPSDGYLPPEDPLLGVSRMIAAAAELRLRHPAIAFIGSGYSYLQEWIGHAAQAALREGQIDAVGLGRMALSYPDLPRDWLGDAPLARRKICRTFSDCTTAPRMGLVSGCYPLDDLYAQRSEARELAALRKQQGRFAARVDT